jgi:hypothetical protein
MKKILIDTCKMNVLCKKNITGPLTLLNKKELNIILKNTILKLKFISMYVTYICCLYVVDDYRQQIDTVRSFLCKLESI